ncbi:MAG: DNA repair protein RecO (recombination protein O) [Oceanicoccus sp.]
MRVDSQQAYVLHTRDYRDSSLLVELLTPEYGRVSGVARGIRSKNKSTKQRRSLMQPFTSLLVSWSGNTDLKTLTHFESLAFTPKLTGRNLFSALYVNELLTRLLQHSGESPEIFTLYQWVLQDLRQSESIEVTLRQFELRLLEYLGYGFDFEADCETGEKIRDDQQYLLNLDTGFSWIRQESVPMSLRERVFNGHDITALACGNYDVDVGRVAKRLCRMALRVHLGDKPLKSRELFGPI